MADIFNLGMDYYIRIGATVYPLCYLVDTDDNYSQIRARLEDPNERSDNGFTLLHEAARSEKDNSRIVQLLLQQGADVDSTTPYDQTPLHLAVLARKRSTVAALLEAGAFVNSKDFWGITALHYSCKPQPYPLNPVLNIDCGMWIVERLLRHPDINLNPVDQDGDTPLMWAVKRRNLDAVRTLLKKGVNPNIPNIDNRTALHEALYAQNPNINIVFALLSHGAGIHCEDSSGQTPVDILLRNVRGNRTLFFAARCVWLIALQYQIKECLQHKLERVPRLYHYFIMCCKEVIIMKKLIICENFTLHDFALDCFQGQVKDSVRKIGIPVIKFLLSGLCSIYFNFIYFRLSMPDLRGVLPKTAGSWSALDIVPSRTSNSTVLNMMRCFYAYGLELKTRLLRLGYLL